MNSKLKVFFLFIVIYCLFCGCSSQRWITVSDKMQIPIEDSKVLIHWDEHQLFIYNANVIEDNIHGYVAGFQSFEPEVQIYLDSTFVLDESLVRVVSIPLRSIDKVEILEVKYKPELTGAIIGGLICGAAVAISIAGTPESEGPYDPGPSKGTAMAVLTPISVVLGAAIGAGIGALIGSARSKEQKTMNKKEAENKRLIR